MDIQSKTVMEARRDVILKWLAEGGKYFGVLGLRVTASLPQLGATPAITFAPLDLDPHGFEIRRGLFC